MTLIEADVAELPPEKQAHYRKCLKNGCTPQLALMLAVKHGPEMMGSDRTFNEGARAKMNGTSMVNEKMFRIAKKAGISTHGKYHVAGLGRYDDHMSWVSTADDVREVLKKKNLSATGLINYQAPEGPPPPPRKRLGEDLISEELSQRIAEGAIPSGVRPNSKAFASRVAALREDVIEEHGGRK